MRDPGFFDGEYRDLDGYDPPVVDQDFEALGVKQLWRPPNESEEEVLGDAVGLRSLDDIADPSKDESGGEGSLLRDVGLPVDGGKRA